MNCRTYDKKRAELECAAKAAREAYAAAECTFRSLPALGHHALCSCEGCNTRWMARIDLDIAKERVRIVERSLRDIVSTREQLIREQPKLAIARERKAAREAEAKALASAQAIEPSKADEAMPATAEVKHVER